MIRIILSNTSNAAIYEQIIAQIKDCIMRFLRLTFSMASLVVMTGRTINLSPVKKVIKVENTPMVALGK